MYIKQNIIQEVGFQLHDVSQLYKSRILNYTGKTTDTKELFTEVIAEELLRLDIGNQLNHITEVERVKGYRVASHTGMVTTPYTNEQTHRKEERFAIELFNLSQCGTVFQHIGKVIDYQVPLKNSRADKGLGKIDLISLEEDRIFLIELKIKENKESMLRCLLEIATYDQVLSKTIFLESYADVIGKVRRIQKAVLIVSGSAQHKEMLGVQTGERKHLKTLIDALEVQVFCIDAESLEIERL